MLSTNVFKFTIENTSTFRNVLFRKPKQPIMQSAHEFCVSLLRVSFQEMSWCHEFLDQNEMKINDVSERKFEQNFRQEHQV